MLWHCMLRSALHPVMCYHACVLGHTSWLIVASTSPGTWLTALLVRAQAVHGAKKVVSVDCNPAQTALLELKKIAIERLPYEDCWQLFGEGRHPRFHHLLLTELGPWMSEKSYRFWLQRCALCVCPVSCLQPCIEPRDMPPDASNSVCVWCLLLRWPQRICMSVDMACCGLACLLRARPWCHR